jgi:hypothetical protein
MRLEIGYKKFFTDKLILKDYWRKNVLKTKIKHGYIDFFNFIKIFQFLLFNIS